MATEKLIEQAIRRVAKSLGWWTLKVAGGQFQTPGIPDLLCLKEGRAVWLEVKTPGGKATPKQAAMMAEIATQAGCLCHVVTSADEAREALLRAGPTLSASPVPSLRPQAATPAATFRAERRERRERRERGEHSRAR